MLHHHGEVWRMIGGIVAGVGIVWLTPLDVRAEWKNYRWRIVVRLLIAALLWGACFHTSLASWLVFVVVVAINVRTSLSVSRRRTKKGPTA